MFRLLPETNSPAKRGNMKTPIAIVAVAIAACLGSIAGHQALSAAPPEPHLAWTVSPGTFQNGVWTIPGTTSLTASVADADTGEAITEGLLVWETCGTGQAPVTHHPAADCQQPGPVRWQTAVVIFPDNPTPISPCLCAGDQQGFRLAYRSRGSGYRNTTGIPFDLFAESNCPTRACP
jgi:hypothetical protein